MKTLHKLVRRDLPAKAARVLVRYGDVYIAEVIVASTPLSPLVNAALRVVSLGQWEDATGRKELHHLFMFLKLVNGIVLRVEKNAVINIQVVASKDIPKGGYTHTLPRPVTVTQFLRNAERRMGKERFYTYDAFHNNCQSFILALLQANQIHVSDQELAYIWENMPSVKDKLPSVTPKVIDTVTTTAAVADRLLPD